VALTETVVDADNVLHVRFEGNPLHQRAEAYDRVYVYLYCPALQEGLLPLHVFRRTKKLDVALPDEWVGEQWYLYAIVLDAKGRASATCYPEDGQRDKNEKVESIDAIDSIDTIDALDNNLSAQALPRSERDKIT
jgi:hypothetical protein